MGVFLCLTGDHQFDWSSCSHVTPHPCSSPWADLRCFSASGICFPLIVEKSHSSCWKEPGWIKDQILAEYVGINLLHRLKNLWLGLPIAKDLQFKLYIFTWVDGTLNLEFFTLSCLSLPFAWVQMTEPFCAPVTSASKWWDGNLGSFAKVWEDT